MRTSKIIVICALITLMAVLIAAAVGYQRPSSLERSLASSKEVDTIQVSMDEYIQFDMLHREYVIHQLVEWDKLVEWDTSGYLIIYTSYLLPYNEATKIQKRLVLEVKPTQVYKGELLKDEYFELAILESSVSSTAKQEYVRFSTERMYEIAQQATMLFRDRTLHNSKKFSFRNANNCNIVCEFVE